MTVYEVWQNEDGTEVGMQPGDHPQRDLLSHDVNGRQMVLIASFAAKSWGEAMEAKEAILWGE